MEDKDDYHATHWVRTPEFHAAHLALEQLAPLYGKKSPVPTPGKGPFEYRKLVSRMMRDSVHDIDEISTVSDFLRAKLLPNECRLQIDAQLKASKRRNEYLAYLYGVDGLLAGDLFCERLPSENSVAMQRGDMAVEMFYNNDGPLNKFAKILANSNVDAAKTRNVAVYAYEKVYKDKGGRLFAKDRDRLVNERVIFGMMACAVDEDVTPNSHITLFSKVRAHDRAFAVINLLRQGEKHLQSLVSKIPKKNSEFALPEPEDVVAVALPKTKKGADPAPQKRVIIDLTSPSPALVAALLELDENKNSKVDMGVELPKQSTPRGTVNKNAKTNVERLEDPFDVATNKPIESIAIAKTSPQKGSPHSSPAKSTSLIPRSVPPPLFSVFRNKDVPEEYGALCLVIKLAHLSGILMTLISRIETSHNKRDEADEGEIEFFLEVPFEEFKFPFEIMPAARGYKLKVNFDMDPVGDAQTIAATEASNFKTLVGLLTLYELLDGEKAAQAFVVFFASEKRLSAQMPTPEGSQNLTSYIAQKNRDVIAMFKSAYGSEPVVYSFKGSFQLVGQPKDIDANDLFPVPQPPNLLGKDEESSVVGGDAPEDSDSDTD